MNRHEEVMKKWRKEKIGGRLYWRFNNRRWYRFFDSGDVAIWREGAFSIHFKSVVAIEEFIEYCAFVNAHDKGTC